ncbi:MAG: hypothetical protein QM627_01790 [Luteolibacter sp.]
MIPVTLPAQPPNFVEDVLTPGQQFLSRVPSPTNDDWKRHRYWRKIHGYLHQQLRGICNYSASFTAFPSRNSNTEKTSIDHFIPKKVPPHHQAYEWNNLRLSRSRLNGRKADYQDVVDPCAIALGWFKLDFTTLFIEPDPDPNRCPLQERSKVIATIERLELNADDEYVNERTRVVYAYAEGRMTFAEVETLYPFIADQMTYQDFDNLFLADIRSALQSPFARAAFLRLGLVEP